MPTYQFEAMDATGNSIKDVIDAQTEEEAQATIKQMGYFVTKLSVKKGRGAPGEKRRGKKAGKSFEYLSFHKCKYTPVPTDMHLVVEGQWQIGRWQFCELDGIFRCAYERRAGAASCTFALNI